MDESSVSQNEFWTAADRALAKGSLVKITCSKPRRKQADKPRNLYGRPLEIRDTPHLQITFRYADREEVKNYQLDDALFQFRKLAGEDYQHFDLFTLDRHLSMVVSRKGRVRLQELAPTHRQPAMTVHNREKRRDISIDRPYLHDLGVTDGNGKVLAGGKRKFVQINKFVEIVDALLKDRPLPPRARIIDMGSGSGYLTFALYDHLAHTLGLDVTVTGVELRPKLVDKCNRIAKENGFHDLNFIEGYIDSFDAERIDMLIALHACDTATDDALKVGADAGAGIMVVAPCCQKQVRKAMEVPSDLAPFLRHGILLERQAAMLTDGIRALLLQAAGYRTKLFEFIPLEHTAKNVMITAISDKPRPEALSEVERLKATFGISNHYLENLLPSPN